MIPKIITSYTERVKQREYFWAKCAQIGFTDGICAGLCQFTPVHRVNKLKILI